jgi:sugar lactone lactonase YvrE
MRLMTKEAGQSKHWQFDENVSAAGWIDKDTLLIASASMLFRFNLTTGASETVIALEADQPLTRSNDGRADPWGGFWIGTMGKEAEPDLGAIYRYHKGALRQLYAPITISNAICFSPDRCFAYFTDTMKRTVMRQRLDSDGWPAEEAEMLIDLRTERLNPDGAVVDQDGFLWIAQWGAGRVARYGADGHFVSTIEFPATQITCPAFGGTERTTLFATSAAVGVNEPEAGKTFAIKTEFQGQQEHQIIL